MGVGYDAWNFAKFNSLKQKTDFKRFRLSLREEQYRKEPPLAGDLEPKPRRHRKIRTFPTTTRGGSERDSTQKNMKFF